MKKLLSLVAAAFLISTASFAQQTPVKTKKHPAIHAAADSVHKKADGTLDKRYKENKRMKDSVIAHRKADGTLDKRFKENKAKAVKKAS